MAILALLFALLLSSSATLAPSTAIATSQPPQLPNQATAQLYVEKLLQSYNALVNSKEYYFANFSTTRQYFSLYENIGESFNVTLVRSFPSSAFVSFIFVPTSMDLNTRIDTNNTLDSIFLPLNSSYQAHILTDPVSDGTIYEDAFVSLPSGITQARIVWETPISYVINNTEVNAKNAAEAIYQADEGTAANPVAFVCGSNPSPSCVDSFYSATIVTTTTKSQTQAHLGSGTPIFLVYLLAGGAVVSFVLQAISWYFGSGRAFIVFLVDARERSQVASEIKRLGCPRKHKQKKQKKRENNKDKE